MVHFLRNRLIIFLLLILLLSDFLFLFSLFHRIEAHTSQSETVAAVFVAGIFLAGILSLFLFLSAWQKNIPPAEPLYSEVRKDTTGINKNVSAPATEDTATYTDSFESVQTLAENLLPAAIPEKLSLFAEGILSHLALKYEIVTGLFYVLEPNSDTFKCAGRYAWYSPDPPPEIRLGESLPGQAVKDKRILYITHVPENYLPVISGLGSSDPGYLLILPIIEEDRDLGFIEIATFKPFNENDIQVLTQLGKLIGKILIRNFEANNRA